MRHAWKAGLLTVFLAACAASTQGGGELSQTVLSTQNIPAAMKGVEARQLFGAAPHASQQASAPFGGYAKGCPAGGVELPETGPIWQAMRLSRNRNWGHPEVVDFVQKLSQFAATQPGWEGLYIGDISQPRGGPMLSGHRSHQIGLDVDIWMRAPKI